MSSRLIGYRKLIVVLATIVSATGLVACDYISDSIYSTVMLAVVGGYIAANVVQKIGVKNDQASTAE